MSRVVEERHYVSQDGGRARSARVGGVMTILAMALVVYGTYGDSQASDSQKSGMPAVLVAVVVVAAIVFGLLAPAGIRAIEAGRSSETRWAVSVGVASVVSLVVFWSGLPLLLGGAALLIAKAGREQNRGSKAFSWAWGLGLFAPVAAIVVTILGNTLH
jgi:hypothetical protein